ncbi:MAG: response regulator receiver protein [Pedosphaera sp.]|nr:response regulator receiver protein [Pedosphaera sp.]
MNPALTLLLVDDNEDDIFLTKRALREAQITTLVQTASDGQQAIDYLSGAGKFQDRALYPLPALMLLDLKMPRKGGLDVLQWIREQASLRSLVVIILTTSLEHSDIERAYQLGANSYLQKPSNTKVLAEIMGAIKLYWLTHNQFFTPYSD